MKEDEVTEEGAAERRGWLACCRLMEQLMEADDVDCEEVV